MESELEKPAPRETVAEKPDEIKLAVSPARCPFCHAGVSLETQDWVACEGCLARHHATCWRENGSCSSCGGRRTLVPERKRGRSFPVGKLAAAILALSGLGVIGYALFELRSMRITVAVLENETLRQRARSEQEAESAHAWQGSSERRLRALEDQVERSTTTGKTEHDKARANEMELDLRLGAVEKRMTFLEEDARARDERLKKLEEARSGSVAPRVLTNEEKERAAIKATALAREALDDLRRTEKYLEANVISGTDVTRARTTATEQFLEAAKLYEEAGKKDDAANVQRAAERLAKGEPFSNVLESLSVAGN
jgi:hypothetical protein